MLQQRYSEELENAMKTFYETLSEKDKRRYAAIEAIKLGHGGQKYISQVLGCDPGTIKLATDEIKAGAVMPGDRVRQPGGGNKKTIDKIENIDEMLFEILSHNTAGSPMNQEIKWTNLTLKEISKAFKDRGYEVTRHVVKQLLRKHKFVKRKMQKTITMKETKNRNEQFENTKEKVEQYTKENNPIISMDVKKKENIGTFYRDGKCYCNEVLKVYDHDFNTFARGVIIPHGIYDIQRNEGYVTLGLSKDTSEFACDCIKDWWNNYGKNNYPDADEILILADGGGSNSSRHYIFKEDLQNLVNEIGIGIRMAHYPPYTSKYNPIEHRMFCHVTRALQGTPFTNIEIVKQLTEKATTITGLKVFAAINNKIYETARKVCENFKENMSIIFDEFLGCWNYKAVPER